MPKFGEITTGKVIKIYNNAALIKLDDGSIGKVHIKEVAQEFVKNINDYLQLQQSVRVKVIGKRDGKIQLSIKKADPSIIFNNQVEKFMKESGRRQAELQKNKDRKRNGGKRKKDPNQK
ncbi:S1 RNA-binding domain-containing protein (plasmid) [Pontibacillus sp. ALD_SL1]|uniref:S1 RNA-binding domain-containing protein n=1 Tax=Pontibacillus sp. ALD_SL1 TaxID=2777185 RepID=UPI001A973B23|nr:S1 RNA-binding domain-containing protein [Pontibacillus sp. ALD_SL1]QST02885.1 S1 RNA-binding domain-containing protein [Pontibacillus sp. ALD_SL1]